MKYTLTPLKGLFDRHPELLILYNETLEYYSKPFDKLDAEQLMAFIVLSYHIKSPIAQEPSAHRRRQMALAEIGYVINTAESIEKNPELAALIVGRNEFVNRLSINFCKFENSIDWSELCSLQDIMDDVELTLKTESQGTDKKSAQEILKLKLEIREKSTKTRAEMRALATNLFNNDMQLLDYAASHMILEKRRRVLSPENYAKFVRDGGDVNSLAN